ncbi:hypothetical protein BU25DRAFT_452006 [Macroventuria anomochaeta]|uniref:Uncharacterized protein n=1 Tax=Macroventuria anomochaeta TaxID=301207 RepID=A0ACB6RMD3_9PLEO|nr:uncharacterized protein BU25DRAFT_452006 [Macroventuria anomochaeta]KAF2622482.1 hypothetical protein BU25DRAFT_452006 [Macroventuria anomochaeta]
MKYRGVVYDVGLDFNDTGEFSVEPFNPALVGHDMRVIANNLHANAVRIEGEEIHRLVTAARLAHSVGLTVFFNPWKMNASIDKTRVYMGEAAQAAEQLRAEGVDIAFVAGCEYSIFSKGIFPGDNFKERGMWFGAYSISWALTITAAAKAKKHMLPVLNVIAATSPSQF